MKSPEAKRRPDGRKALLLYLNPKLILALKQKALEEDRPAYAIVEEILSQRFAEGGKGRSRS